jgi:hypothetical protein
MKDDESGFYLLCSKKQKVLDTLSYDTKDSLFNFEIDTIFLRSSYLLGLKFALLNKSKGDNYRTNLYAKKIAALDVSNKKVCWSFLYQLDFSRTDYHNYQYPNDANLEEETNFGYNTTYTYKIVQSTRSFSSILLQKIVP